MNMSVCNVQMQFPYAQWIAWIGAQAKQHPQPRTHNGYREGIICGVSYVQVYISVVEAERLKAITNQTNMNWIWELEIFTFHRKKKTKPEVIQCYLFIVYWILYTVTLFRTPADCSHIILLWGIIHIIFGKFAVAVVAVIILSYIFFRFSPFISINFISFLVVRYTRTEHKPIMIKLY